jgi:hypothetical protein
VLAAENKSKIWGALRSKCNTSLPPLVLLDYCRALVGGEPAAAPPGAPIEQPPSICGDGASMEADFTPAEVIAAIKSLKNSSTVFRVLGG